MADISARLAEPSAKVPLHGAAAESSHLNVRKNWMSRMLDWIAGDCANNPDLLGHQPPRLLQMPVDITAILVSSTFMGAGLALAKFFPESSLLAAFFLGGLALVNIGLSIAG